MVILVIIVVIVAIISWLLVSPIVLEIDTRVPALEVRWITIGSGRIWFDNEWWLSVRILFFRKTIRFSDIKSGPKKIKSNIKTKPARKLKPIKLWMKTARVVKTFRVIDWKLLIDTGDYVWNAQLYPLNFLPYAFEHLQINFQEENYLLLKIRNRPWKLLYAYLR